MNNKSSLKFDSGVLCWSILRIFYRFEREWIIQLSSIVCSMKEGGEVELNREDQQETEIYSQMSAYFRNA